MMDKSLSQSFKPQVVTDCEWLELYTVTEMTFVAEKKHVYVEFPGRTTSFKKHQVASIDSINDNISLLTTIKGDEYELNIAAQQLRDLLDQPKTKSNCLDLKQYQTIELADFLSDFKGQKIDLMTLNDLLSGYENIIEDVSFLYPLKGKTRKVLNKGYNVENDDSNWGNAKISWGENNFMRTVADAYELQTLRNVQKKLGIKYVDYTVRGRYALRHWTSPGGLPPSPTKLPLRNKVKLRKGGFDV